MFIAVYRAVQVYSECHTMRHQSRQSLFIVPALVNEVRTAGKKVESLSGHIGARRVLLICVPQLDTSRGCETTSESFA